MVNLNPHISVDCVVFGFDFNELKVLLIERKLLSLESDGLYSVDMKLPGNLISDDEDLNTSAYRTLKELTGLENIYLQQFHVFDSPERTKNKKDIEWLETTSKIHVDRIVSVAYYSLVRIDMINKFKLMITNNARWVPISETLTLAFDHSEIIKKGLETLREKILSEPIAFELLPKKFTLNQLHKIYEVILNQSIDNRNFRKKVKKLDYIYPIEEREQNVAHKPAQFYRFDRKKYFQHKKETMMYNI